MSELKPRITENGIDYILVGDYYIPDLKLPEEHRPIGKYGRMHREYLREVHPARLNTLTLTGQLLQLSILHKNYCLFSPFPPIMAAFSAYSFCLLFLGAHLAHKGRKLSLFRLCVLLR